MSHPPQPLETTRRGEPSGTEAQASQQTGRTLDSAALLQGHNQVLIRHQGVLYRLQATRLGKLILTK